LADFSDTPEEDVTDETRPAEETNKPRTAAKRKRPAEKTATKKKKSGQKCVVAEEEEAEGGTSNKPKRKRKKKKTITDVVAASGPRAGSPADLQKLVTQYFSDKRSVIEQEELRLPDSCFLSSNDLTHTLASYLKQVCPKWAKIQKTHTEKSSVVLLIVCSSALRTIELIKQLTAFRGAAKVLKLFAKHIKIEEQVKLLQKGVTHIGVGTPGRISALVEKDALNVRSLRYLVFGLELEGPEAPKMVDIPEIKLDFMKMMEGDIFKGCREDKIKIGLF
uniref:Cms1 ribosomal small subunit homolog n=1 Tax=Tetraodon nigroviridis TaxID=99883 RepID=H3CB24_TETNG